MAHPGHELRVHHWTELHRPLAFVLTDGSGRNDTGRIDSSRRVLVAAKAKPADCFGRWRDREAYRIMLDQRAAEVQSVIDEIASALVAADVEQIASDAIEGYSPTHDLCSIVAESAARIAEHRLGRPIRHLEFPLEAEPGAIADTSGAIRIDLDEPAMERKLEAARTYDPLRGEVERALENHSTAAFRSEWLSPAAPGRDLRQLAVQRGRDRPRYEDFGEQRVAGGSYTEVLRFTQHWLPLAASLRRWAADA
ncbi:MAG: hypothetical protein AAGC60_15370 [Acidobacteriota bacterium]